MDTIMVMVALLIALLLLLAFLLFGDYFSLRNWNRRRKEEIVRTNSEYYQRLLALNARTRVDTSIVEEKHSYVSRSQTLQDFETMNKNSTLRHLVQGSKRSEIVKLLSVAENNRMSRLIYDEECRCLSSTITKERCKEIGISYEDFLAIESILVYDNKLQIPEDFEVCCMIVFGVMGKIEKSKMYRFSAQSLRNAINGDFRNEDDEEAQRRQQERNRVTPSVRYRVIARDGGRCCLCGRSAKDGVTLEVDHIIPISKGGTSDEENLQTLCRDCNRGKGVDIS